MDSIKSLKLRQKSFNYVTLGFLIPFISMLILMIVNGVLPFGSKSLLYSDGYHQYYPFFKEFRRALLSGDSLLYNWNIGLGNWFYFLVFNQPFIIAGQYWFLFALLYVYIMYAIISRFGWLKYAYILAVLMFVAYITLAQGMYLAGIRIPNLIYRNFLIEGFAYFMLGHWIHKNQSTLRISNHILVLTIVITTLLCLLERYLLGRDFGVNIVTIPQVFCLFLYAVNNPQKHKGVIQEVGERYSMYVYILHPFVWHVLEYIYGYYHLQTNTLALYAMPVLVLFISLLLSHIVYMGNAKLLTQRKQNYA